MLHKPKSLEIEAVDIVKILTYSWILALNIIFLVCSCDYPALDREGWWYYWLLRIFKSSKRLGHKIPLGQHIRSGWMRIGLIVVTLVSAQYEHFHVSGN